MIKKNFNFICNINLLQSNNKKKLFFKKFISLILYLCIFLKIKNLFYLLQFNLFNFLFYIFFIFQFKIQLILNLELKKIYSLNKLELYNSIKKVLSLKLIRLKLEKILYLVFKYNIKVFLTSIFDVFKLEDKIIFEKTQLLRHSRLFFFFDFIHFFFFSIYFKKSFLLAKFISKNITNNKKSHFSFLKQIKKLSISLLLHGFFYNLIGFKLSVHGKFQGKLRKRKFKFFLGKSSLTSIFKLVNYDLQQSFTKFGVFSIKVWMFFLA